jgi:two-component system, NtrC family, response regulator HydG
MLKVLVVDDDQGLRLAVKSALVSSNRFAVEEAFDGINALEKYEASQPKYDIIILDVDMPRLNGLETLKRLKEKDPGLIVIMLTANATVQDAVLAVKDGAYNYLSKPVSADDLLALLEKAVEAHRLISSIAASSPVLLEEGRKIIGSNSQMQKVFNIIHKLAKVETPVLIRGASGTGKELVARAIHFNSARKDGKFVAINCSAIPENLFESELFGHEKGSFTGAEQRKVGKFQYAEGGTLFLDEVGDMPALMQVKILRVLQEKMFTPVGSNREFPTNVRIIAATNRPLEDMIQKGIFREDLFYRLNVVPVILPSLADRKDDIDRMIQNFIRKFNDTHKKAIRGISHDAVNILKKYNWPGNIRELENVIEHSFVLETSQVITPVSLPESLLSAVGVDLLNPDSLQSFKPPQATSIGIDPGIDVLDSDLDLDDDSQDEAEVGMGAGNSVNENFDFNAQKEAFEKDFIIKALKAFRGRINQTALHANIPKKTLLRKIEKYGIVAKDFQ